MKETLRQERFYLSDLNARALESTTSKGNQPKWYVPETQMYLKQDYHGYESLAEWVVSKILLEYSTIPFELITEYTACYLDEKPACYSYSFRTDDEDEITLATILGFQYPRYHLTFKNKSHSEQFELMVHAIKEYSGIDISKELKLMFAVDAFFLNIDRHLNNISVLESSEGNYRFTPIFDNGLSLLAYMNDFPLHVPPSINISKAKPVLLTSKFKNHAKFYDGEPFLYKEEILDFIKEYEKDLGRIYDIIRHQLRNPDLQHFFIT